MRRRRCSIAAGGVGKSAQRGGRDRPSDAETDTASLFVEEFPRQLESAQRGMNQAGQLERHAVGAAKKQRHGGGSGALRQARYRGVPGRVRDGAIAQVEVRDFAGGKGHEQAAAMEPAETFLQGRRVGGDRAAAAERIGKDAEVAQLGNRREHRVGEDLYVGTDTRQQRG